jgi:hypothetical protein
MNRYGVTVNHHPERIVQASAARTAVDRAMAHFIEGEFKPHATVKVRFVGKVNYTWDVVADTPFDYGENGKGTKRETVLAGLSDEEYAWSEGEKLKVAHPDWKFVRVVKRAVAEFSTGKAK